jgi:hypothetical protein
MLAVLVLGLIATSSFLDYKLWHSPARSHSAALRRRVNDLSRLFTLESKWSADMSHRGLEVRLPPPAENRTLVVIIGSIRGGEKAWSTLYENVLNVNSADLALMVGETRDVYSNSSLFNRAKYHWKVQEYDDWADAIDLINGPKWREEVLPRLDKGIALGGIKDQLGSGAIIFMIRWFLSEKIKELKLLDRYDTFIITRSDHYYLCKHDVTGLSLNKIWIPEGSDHSGVTDRHLVASKNDILTALDLLPHILSNFEQYKDLLDKDYRPRPEKMTNPEILIKRRFQLADLWDRLGRLRRVMFTCAMPGDTTRWHKEGSTFVKEGVLLKYELEYHMSHRTCGKK